jgi:hypothetical protein
LTTSAIQFARSAVNPVLAQAPQLNETKSPEQIESAKLKGNTLFVDFSHLLKKLLTRFKKFLDI